MSDSRGFSAPLPDAATIHVPTGHTKKSVYKREILYEEVWAEPLVKVAQRYGVTSVALAKMCRRLDVPVPGRGYWAKKRAGRSSKPMPLRARPAGVPEEVVVERFVYYTPEEHQAMKETERQRVEAIQKAKRDAEEEKRRVKALRETLEDWRMARDVRAFVAEGQRIVIDGGCKITKDGPLEEFFEWALDYADQIDPYSDMRKRVAAMAAGAATNQDGQAQR